MLDKIKEVLGSTRFWAVVIIAVFKALNTEGYVPGVIFDFVLAVLGPYTVMRTIDNFGRRLGGIK